MVAAQPSCMLMVSTELSIFALLVFFMTRSFSIRVLYIVHLALTIASTGVGQALLLRLAKGVYCLKSVKGQFCKSEGCMSWYTDYTISNIVFQKASSAR